MKVGEIWKFKKQNEIMALSAVDKSIINDETREIFSKAIVEARVRIVAIQEELVTYATLLKDNESGLENILTRKMFIDIYERDYTRA